MNRLKGVVPDYCWKIVWNEEERLYLEKLVRSRRPFDRYLCLNYVGAGIYSAKNRRLVIDLLEVLVADCEDDIHGQARIELTQLLQERPSRSVWPIIIKHCSSLDQEYRRYFAISVLESPFRDHFNFYFPRIRKLAEAGNTTIVDALSACYFFDLTLEQLDALDALFDRYLGPERLDEWKKNLPLFRGEKKERKELDCSWHAPAPGENRLVGQQPLDFWRHHVVLNTKEKAYLQSLANSSRSKDRLLCLAFLEMFVTVRKNASFVLRIVDQLIPERNPRVRWNSIKRLKDYLERVDRKKGWRIVLKYASSPNHDIREQITWICLQWLFDTYPEEFLGPAKREAERGNHIFVQTLSECWFLFGYKEDLDALDSLFAHHLDQGRLRIWNEKLKVCQKYQRIECGDQRRHPLRDRLYKMLAAD